MKKSSVNLPKTVKSGIGFPLPAKKNAPAAVQLKVNPQGALTKGQQALNKLNKPGAGRSK